MFFFNKPSNTIPKAIKEAVSLGILKDKTKVEFESLIIKEGLVTDSHELNLSKMKLSDLQMAIEIMALGENTALHQDHRWDASELLKEVGRILGPSIKLEFVSEQNLPPYRTEEYPVPGTEQTIKREFSKRKIEIQINGQALQTECETVNDFVLMVDRELIRQKSDYILIDAPSSGDYYVFYKIKPANIPVYRKSDLYRPSPETVVEPLDL